MHAIALPVYAKKVLEVLLLTKRVELNKNGRLIFPEGPEKLCRKIWSKYPQLSILIIAKSYRYLQFIVIMTILEIL